MKQRIRLFILFSIIALCSKAQMTPQKHIDTAFIQANYDDALFLNKKFDTCFQTQIKAALLFYPELKNAKITVKIKQVKSPLSARPSVWAIFQKPKNRRYIVLISTKTIDRLEPILLKNLSFNAQIGVLGHELSHVADFHQRKSGYFIKLILMHLNKKSMDSFENETDRRCIEHGLGHQLLAWSTEVRQNLKIKEWHGANQENTVQKGSIGEGVAERYMSPKTIENIMKEISIY